MTDTNANSAEQIASPTNPWELLAMFGAAVMENSWLVLLYQAMGPATASDPTWIAFGFFLLAMIAAMLASRLMNSLQLTKRIERGLLAGYLILSYLAGSRLLLQDYEQAAFNPFETNMTSLGELTAFIPGEVWLAGALSWLLWRGFTFGRQGVGRFAVFNYLRLGIGMFLVFGLVSLNGNRELPGLGMFGIFLFAALMAMSAARVSFLGRIRGGRRNPFTRQWLGSILGAVLSTVVTGFSIALLAVGRLQGVIQFIIGMVFALAFAPLLFLAGLFSSTEFPEIISPTPTPGSVLPPWEQDTGLVPNLVDDTNRQIEALPDQVRGIVYILGILLGALLIILLIWGVSKAYRRVAGNPEIEYVVKRGDLMEMLRKEAGDQLRQPGEWVSGRLRGRKRVQAAARVRQIYGDFLDLCVELAIPRLDSQTPLEFLRIVEHALPTVGDQLGAITQAYLKVRYGELPETQEEVLSVENAWEEVQRIGGMR